MMDQHSQYPSNGLSNNSPYSNLPNISPHQLSNNGPSHTLPPLQPQQHAMMYGSAPQTPRTPTTPNTAGSNSNMGYAPMSNAQRGAYQSSMPMNNYSQAPPYRVTTSTSMPVPQAIAPAPPQGRMQPHPLAPMPPQNGMHMQPGMNSPYGQPHMMAPAMMEDQPTHVVGSQGRRGILPSAPGRPAVTATGTGSTKNAMIPAKDADGKFPCPHCTKTYLHAKHLKRHLLRHTGDRPYMCVLCRDTFSRSDILKRHFQKCSIRRGNPTGASHLSHAQAHLKKSHPGPHKGGPSISNENDMMNVNGMNMADPALQSFGVIPDGSVPDAATNMTNEQAAQEQLSQANGMKRYSQDGGRNVRVMAGSIPNNNGRPSFENYAGGIASTMPSGMNPPIVFNTPNGQNLHSYSQTYDFASNGSIPATALRTLPNGRAPMPMFSNPNNNQQSPEWPESYQSNNQNRFPPSFIQHMSDTQVPVKHEPTVNNGVYVKPESDASSGLFPSVHPVTSSNDYEFPTWNLQNDPLQLISRRLLYLCFPGNSPISSRNIEIKKYLSADNIRHFLEHFSSFQGHFPILHMPTFRIEEVYDGLLLAMICIGAVYSQRISPAQVRDMMDLAKSVIESNSKVYIKISHQVERVNGYATEVIGTSAAELEEITAIFMIHILSTLHGNPFQREKARQQFSLIVALARKAGLTQPITTAPFSALHQPHVAVEHFNAANFDWSAWVAQEKRSRLMYAIFLVDAAMLIYFNVAPLFETLEVRLPLPADDAAWDATTAVSCAEALGLYGPNAARGRNQEGSRRAKQPEMHSALQALLHNVYDLQSGTTNIYSKFILVHALHIQLWTAQRQLSQEASDMSQQGTFSSSGTSTPMSQHDWVTRGLDSTGSGGSSANNSGQVTPVETSQANLSHQLLKAATHGLEKWKKAWDEDMAIQYPPTSRSNRRFGFCRDGVHFYWLAKYLLQNPRAMDWNTAPDQRFSQVMNILTSVKTWVISDSAKRGEELGSVCDINKDYGITDLTLDMAQFFKPINKQIDSPVVGVQTNVNGGGAI